MIKGMTGFGSVQTSAGAIKAVVEIKSLNHRYFDINYFLPIGFGILEDKIRQIVQREINRGRVTVSVKIMQKPTQSISINKEAVRAYLKSARQLSREHKVPNNLGVSDLIKLPGVLETKEFIARPEATWPALSKSIKKAVGGLMVMRKREGRSLSADIGDKLRRMFLQIKRIEARSRVLLREKRGKLTVEEFSSYQKSSDINEEISRLKHYVNECRLLIKTNISVGKKIDFIAQEMQRETNTIGSKLQDKVVSNAVIALKSKVEKIREQSQNIE